MSELEPGGWKQQVPRGKPMEREQHGARVAGRRELPHDERSRGRSGGGKGSRKRKKNREDLGASNSSTAAQNCDSAGFYNRAVENPEAADTRPFERKVESKRFSRKTEHPKKAGCESFWTPLLAKGETGKSSHAFR